MTELRFSGQTPSQVARHFLDLLDDVYRMHGLFLDEITALRARIAELEGTRGLDGARPFPNIPDVPGCAVYLVSHDGTIQSWSGGACELYGYSVEEVIGRLPRMLCPEGTAPVEAWPVPLPALQVSRRLRKDGRVFAVHLHHAAIPGPAGQACSEVHIEIPLEADSARSQLAGRGDA